MPEQIDQSQYPHITCHSTPSSAVGWSPLDEWLLDKAVRSTNEARKVYQQFLARQKSDYAQGQYEWNWERYEDSRSDEELAAEARRASGRPSDIEPPKGWEP